MLSSEKKFDLTILNPDGSLVLAKKDISEYKVQEKVPTAGNYGFCFTNHYRSSIVVGFEYDHFESSPEAKFDKKMKNEKRQFFMSVSKKYEKLMKNENDSVTLHEELLLDKMRETREENGMTQGTYDQVKVGTIWY